MDSSEVQGSKPLKGKEDSLKKTVTSDLWNIQIAITDVSLNIICKNPDEEYELHSEFSQIPASLTPLCDNFHEAFELLGESQSLKIAEQKLMVGCMVGKLSKTIKIILQRAEVPLEEQIRNKNLLLAEARSKVRTLEKFIQVQKQLNEKKIKELENQIEIDKNIRINKEEEMKLFERKKSLLQWEYKQMFKQCSKWGCNKMVNICKQYEKCNNYPICSPEHKWR